MLANFGADAAHINQRFAPPNQRQVLAFKLRDPCFLEEHFEGFAGTEFMNLDFLTAGAPANRERLSFQITFVKALFGRCKNKLPVVLW